MASDTEEAPQLHFSVWTLIRSFFGTLTADQWLLLIQGDPDEPTKDLLLNLIVTIIKNLAGALQIFIRNSDVVVTKELVNSCLSNGVIDGFRDALDVKVGARCPDAEALRNMISEEVLVTVLWSISKRPGEHVPHQKRQIKMLSLASKMIKTIKRKVRPLHSCCVCPKEEDVKSEKPTTSFQLPPLPHTKAAKEKASLKFIADMRNWYDPSSSEDHYSSESTSPLPSRVKPLSSKIPLAIPKTLKHRYDVDPSQDSSIGFRASLKVRVKPSNVKHTEPEKAESKAEGEKTQKVKKEKVVRKPCSSSSDGGSEGSVQPIGPSVAVEEAFPDPSLEEKRKNTVGIVLEKLVSLIYLKSKVSNQVMDPASVIERLMTKTWAVVEGADFDPSPKTVAGLDEAIFKRLVKKWGGAEMVLLNMRVGSQALEKFVVDAVKARLAPPPKKRLYVVVRAMRGYRKVTPSTTLPANA